MKEYKKVYPEDLHLKHELRYYMMKYDMVTELVRHLLDTQKKHISICDIGGGFGYDDILIRNIVHTIDPTIVIDVDVIDPSLDFYKKIHKLPNSGQGKQSQINYFEDSFLTIDTEKNKEKYDIVISSEVIEHLRTSEQEVFFNNFNMILKKGGLILISCPNGSSVFKNCIGLYKRKQGSDELFEAEFNHRYAHIGIPTLFQVMGLFQRKGFRLKKITPTTLASSTRLSIFSLYLSYMLRIFPFINLFWSTDNLFVGVKQKTLDTSKRYNTFKI